MIKISSLLVLCTISGIAMAESVNSEISVSVVSSENIAIVDYDLGNICIANDCYPLTDNVDVTYICEQDENGNLLLCEVAR